MRSRVSRTLVAVLVAVSAGGFTADRVGARTQAARYTAFAIDIAGGASGMVEINIERWSTDAEANRITTILAEQGAAKMLDALRALPRVGSIATTGSIGLDIRLATRTADANGTTRVMLLTDRNVQFYEQMNQGRSLDYPFTQIELRLNPNGTGRGQLDLAMKITYDRRSKTMVLERFGSQPIALNDVKTVR